MTDEVPKIQKHRQNRTQNKRVLQNKLKRVKISKNKTTESMR